jgi:hypothetical protein
MKSLEQAVTDSEAAITQVLDILFTCSPEVQQNAVRLLVSLAATMAMGAATVRRFNQGGDIQSSMNQVQELLLREIENERENLM